MISTRNLKKEINSINETLDRSFHIVEEMVFADATKDPTAKQAYKQIVGINEAFKKLTEGVTETGQAKNATLDLESKVRCKILYLSLSDGSCRWKRYWSEPIHSTLAVCWKILNRSRRRMRSLQRS